MGDNTFVGEVSLVAFGRMRVLALCFVRTKAGICFSLADLVPASGHGEFLVLRAARARIIQSGRDGASGHLGKALANGSGFDLL